ncbi:MAG: radical SAM protein [Planctomycetes bacterium]|nr:radical SAM protein [Planctomycetota bacterium]
MYENIDAVSVLQKRQWVRLTNLCNQRCVFCLDADQHDGTYRGREEVDAELRDGRARGCQRLILSGGEASIHPDFHWFIARGRELGYERVQTVTNGRMWSQRGFVSRAVRAGLHEVTFSIHGHTADLHDALVAVPGAFDEAIAGVRNCLASRRLIVSVDIVMNSRNVGHTPEIVSRFADLGVGEFDLMIMIPFGRANPAHPSSQGGTWGEVALARKLLLCRDEAREVIPAVMALAKARGLVVWTNRLPAHYLEGFEHLIQNPKKFHDELHGRRREMQAAIAGEHWMPCWDERCRWCFLDRFCARFRRLRDERRAGRVSHGSWNLADGPLPRETDLSWLTLAGPDLDAILAAAAAAYPDTPLDAAPASPPSDAALRDLSSRPAPARLLARAPEIAQPVVAAQGASVVCALTPAMFDWLRGKPLAGVTVIPDNSFNADHDPMPPRLADALPLLAAAGARVQGFPLCLAAGAEPFPWPADPWPLGMAPVEGGEWNLTAAVDGYLHDHYRVYASRCRECGARPACPGLSVQYVRARGFAELDPSRFPAIPDYEEPRETPRPMQTWSQPEPLPQPLQPLAALAGT